MRRIALLTTLLILALPVAAQQRPAPPHAWLFGAWTGGLFPPPVSLSAQECLAQPTVIFTRDSILRVSVTDPAYIQRLVETVRGTGTGVEFRLVTPPQPLQGSSGGMFNLTQPGETAIGFGCGDPNVLRVQRRGDNEISFPHCPEFPYPLMRCPSR